MSSCCWLVIVFILLSVCNKRMAECTGILCRNTRDRVPVCFCDHLYAVCDAGIKGGKFSKSAVCVNIALERSVEKDTHTLDSRTGGITACFFTLWNGHLGNKSCVESVGKRISYMRADLVDNAGRNLSSALFSGNAFRKWSLSGSRGDAESDCGIALYWIRRWTLDVVSMWMEWTSAVVLCKMENRERSV